MASFDGTPHRVTAAPETLNFPAYILLPTTLCFFCWWSPFCKSSSYSQRWSLGLTPTISPPAAQLCISHPVWASRLSDPNHWTQFQAVSQHQADHSLLYNRRGWFSCLVHSPLSTPVSLSSVVRMPSVFLLLIDSPALFLIGAARVIGKGS